jgi:hypothetical protein
MKIETVALILEPTVLIILSFLKSKEDEIREFTFYNEEKKEHVKTEIVIKPSTYGTLKSEEHVKEDLKSSYASEKLEEFNRKLMFMKEDFVMVVAMSYYKRNAKKFAITAAKRS